MRWEGRTVWLTVCLITAVSACLGQASNPLTNADVLKMLASGLSGETVEAKIHQSQCNFDTSVAALAELKKADVPDAVILAMVNAPTSSNKPAEGMSASQPPIPRKIEFNGKKVKLSHTGRIYNLTTGERLEVRFSMGWSGAGVICTVLRSGEMLTGEYRSVPRGYSEWGSIYGSISSRGQATAVSTVPGASPATTTASGEASTTVSGVRSRNVSAMEVPGRAVASGDRGSVLTCEYVVSAWTNKGYGACRDQSGTIYELIF